ncbi:MAG: hypothetical protein JO228_15285 [Xanthobacteraceae bacterium]|nr:hypothetical protein [Xanthobacteraceae bacterium]
MTYYRGIDPIGEDNWLIAKVKQNPEAFLVMAAGCALLMRSGGSWSRGSALYRNGAWSDEGRWGRTAASARDYASDVAGRMQDTARDYASDVTGRIQDTARNYASDVKDRMQDTANAVSETASSYAGSISETASAMSQRAADYASSMSDQASQWGRQVAEQTNRMSAQARASMEQGVGRMVREQPFTVAALGLVAGAAIAALLPRTEAEQQAFRPIRDAATDALANAKESVKEAVSAAGEQLKEGAQRRGLSADGIKDLAREATETFSDKLSGKSTDQVQPSPASGV